MATLASNNDYAAKIEAPQTPDELMEKALAVLRDCAHTAERFSSAIAGSIPLPCGSETEAPHECFVDRHESAMREVIRLSSEIYNELSRARSRLGL